MKNIPFFLKFLGVSVLFVYVGMLALSTYLNIFFLKSVTVSLSQMIRNKVDINSINVSFREGILFNINGLEIRSNQKNRILLSAEKISALITYSSLFSKNIKIKKYYIRQPNVYVQYLLPEFRKKFPYFNLRKVVDGYPSDNKLENNIKRNLSYGEISPMTQPGVSGNNFWPPEPSVSIKNKFRSPIIKQIKNIIIHPEELIKPVEVTQARILFSKEINPWSLLDGLSGSFRIRVLKPNKNSFNLKIDKINAIAKEYRVVGEILGENFLSKDALIRADVIFLSSHIQGETKVKFQFPLKDVNNFKSLVKHIDLTGSIFSRNLRLPIKIIKFHLPILEIRFKLRNGMVNYNLVAVCPRGYPQITKFEDGVITFKGGGSLNYINDNHVTMKINPFFSVKNCESPDYFKWLNELSGLKFFKEQNFISTNAHGKASLVIDYLPSAKNFSGKGSIYIKDLMLHSPPDYSPKKSMEIKILSLAENQATLNWGGGRLTLIMDSKFSEGNVGLQGIINYKETDKKKSRFVDPYIKVNGFHLSTIIPSSGRQFSSTSRTLSADIKVEGVIKEKHYKFRLEGLFPLFKDRREILK